MAQYLMNEVRFGRVSGTRPMPHVKSAWKYTKSFFGLKNDYLVDRSNCGPLKPDLSMPKILSLDRGQMLDEAEIQFLIPKILIFLRYSGCDLF